MDTNALIGEQEAVNGKLRLFSLYLDFAASAHARWAACTITKLVGPRWQSSTEMWKIDSLGASESVRKMIASDAAAADVLIIAASSLDQRELKLIEWLDSLAVWNANRPVPGLLIGLFGDEENQSRELEWTIQQFIYCARRMSRELVVQWMEQGARDDCRWLTERAQTLLARKQSACNQPFQTEPTVEIA
ncbi:MAG: hypothetical protein WAO21_02490 [Verrucomicrobiia bacterium]|jgi:hypothetical protein